jgi:hypothetical protein
VGGHWANLLPILKNSFAPRRRLELCRPRSTRWPPASTLVSRVEDLVYAGCHFAGVRSTFCDRIHLFGSRIRIDGEMASGMRPDTACLWKTECVSISNQDRISQHACGHWSTIHDAASQLPRSRQSVVILLRGSRLRGCAARLAVCATSGDRYDSTKSQDRYCFDHPSVLQRKSPFVESSVMATETLTTCLMLSGDCPRIS